MRTGQTRHDEADNGFSEFYEGAQKGKSPCYHCCNVRPNISVGRYCICDCSHFDFRIVGKQKCLVTVKSVYSRTPLIRTLIIRISNYPERFGPSGKYFLTPIALHFCALHFPPIFQIQIRNFVFLISSFRRVLYVVCFLLGNYPFLSQFILLTS